AALLTIFVVKEDFHAGTDAGVRTSSAAAGTPHRTNRAAVAALLVTAMMVLLANMSIEPIITVYIGGLGVGGDHLARVAGVVMACSAFGSMLTAARLGALADRIGSWNVIIGCLLLTALAMVPQAFVTHWWQLAALRGLMGMTLAGLLPSIGKLVRQSVDERATGQMLGYLQSAQFSGQVIGPVIGGQIGVALGLHSVFFVTGALLAVCAGLAHWARGR
ncbi:MFS transporter, partial [Burkholderia sp. Ac-20392]